MSAPGGAMSASVATTGRRQSWVLHVDLDQFIARGRGAAAPRLPGSRWWSAARATRPSVAWWRRRRARPGSSGSGPGCRCGSRPASAPTVFLPADHTAYDAASAEVMDTLRSLEWGGVPVVVEVLGWDEAFLAAGEGRAEDLGDPRDFAEHVRARVLGRPACTPRSGSATPSCGPRSRPTSASRAGCGS